MGENMILTGMILNVMPMGEYDKRISILTMEQGKITAFAKGARRPNSQLLAASSPFSFGEFELFRGKSSYTLAKATIKNYFRELSMDPGKACYGFYFLEIAAYYAQENNDERQLLILLYQTLRALEKPQLNDRLVKCIYELKVLAINGEYPNVFECLSCGKKEDLHYFSMQHGGILCRDCGKKSNSFLLNDSTLYTMQYIISTPSQKLYTFQVSDEVLRSLEKVMKRYYEAYVRHEFKSLDILNTILQVEIT